MTRQRMSVSISYSESSLRLFGQRMGARRDSGEFEKNLNFLIGCSVLALQRLPLFYRRNLAVIKFQYPRISPGEQPLAKEP